MLSGALRPDAGTVTVDIGRRRPVPSRMPQVATAVLGRRAREQVALAGWLGGAGLGHAGTRQPGALVAVDLADHADRPARHLSGGQLRRLALAEVLVCSPRVLLLDEPTVGLDPVQRDEIRRLIVELGERCQVVLATHLVEDLAHGFDSATVLDSGTIRFDGSVDGFLGLIPDSEPVDGTLADRLTAAYRACLDEPSAVRQVADEPRPGA
ncbi:MAG: ATP-binding cassette domain-containing protein [Acidimicrobiales bacterium]